MSGKLEASKREMSFSPVTERRAKAFVGKLPLLLVLAFFFLMMTSRCTAFSAVALQLLARPTALNPVVR